MALNLMYITNNPDVALIAEAAGVDRIFVDLEYIGKADRQGGMDTVQSHHTVDDVKRLRPLLKKSKLLARCNPIHDKTDAYCSSKEEIDRLVEAGADIIMLPYFKTVLEVETFLKYVDSRCKTMLLVETPEAVNCIDKILELKGIDFIHIGINDLSLGYHKKFMFEMLTDGTVEMLCAKFKKAGIPYGFGGIASLGQGIIPAEMIIMEHYRLESSCAILSRSFCNLDKETDLETIKNKFDFGVKEIRIFEQKCELLFKPFFENEKELHALVQKVVCK